MHKLLTEKTVATIVVVDNASSDGTKLWLQSLSDIRLHRVYLNRNSGGAGGFAAGMEAIFRMNKDFDWLLTLDDDAWPAPDAISRFQKKCYPPQVVSIASAVYLPNGEISKMNRPGFRPLSSFIIGLKTVVNGSDGFHLSPDHYAAQKLLSVDFSSFVGFFIRYDIAKNLGLPRSDWFLYGDDLEYILRIGEAGYQHYFDPEIRFIHDCATLVKNKKIYKPLWRAYYTYRNGIFVYRIVAGRYFYIILPAKIVVWLLATRHYRSKVKYLKLLWLAVYHGLTGKTNMDHRVLDLKYAQ